MAGFLYFLDRVDAGVVRREQIDKFKLGYAFGDGVASVRCLCGPDGKSGMIVAPDQTDGALMGFFADRQKWFAIPKTDVCVGCYTDGDAPKPESVARPMQLGGHWLTLGDGQKWLVPVGRGLTEEDGDLRWCHVLPDRTTLDEKGDWVTDGVAAEYVPLWDIATRWATVGETAGDDRVRYDTLHDDALAALAINYRLGRAECALLGLLNTGICRDILDAVVDVPTHRLWLQKKTSAAAAGSSSSDGLED